MLKLEKVGKTSRQFRYDLNQIPYDYTMKMMNRFKRLDLVEYAKDYGWRSVTFMGGDDQNHPKEKEMQEGKVVV